MRKSELKVLHGLHYIREVVNDSLPFSADEIYWLTKHSFKEGKKWRAKNSLNKLEAEGADYLEKHAKTSFEVNKILSYLQSKGYITYQKHSNFFRVAVTGSGADIAREADTGCGRINIWYKEHKTGILGLIITVLISVITSYATTTISKHTDTPSHNSKIKSLNSSNKLSQSPPVFPASPSNHLLKPIHDSLQTQPHNTEGIKSQP